jgi:hypothetical protein
VAVSRDPKVLSKMIKAYVRSHINLYKPLFRIVRLQRIRVPLLKEKPGEKRFLKQVSPLNWLLALCVADRMAIIAGQNGRDPVHHV